MSKKESISRYILIIKKLKKHPATFAEISDYLAFESEFQGLDFNISKRTFQRDLEDIRTIYKIDIEYDFAKRVYCIKYNEQPEVSERIFEAFDTFNALNISDRLSNFIHFEKRPPQGTDNMYGLLHAIQNQVQITFNYQKFWDDEITMRRSEPYSLKEFKNRWYLLANDLKDKKIKTFALDRLTELEISSTKFLRPSDFDITDYFRYSFGIISPNQNLPEEIILAIDPFQGKYIKSLPLHETQEIIEDNDNRLLIKLKMFITHDFIMEILSYGESVKVLQPASLIDKVKQSYTNALSQY